MSWGGAICMLARLGTGPYKNKVLTWRSPSFFLSPHLSFFLISSLSDFI